ncbi:hypothetical protein SDC9_40635 [bioreactor metagenome]|uniref:Peptidase MA-like domain-containing protein n=1 Tax=bioreactor metagenome TaxID=1076179 RepID=A0A644VSV3_9ZZZZ
MTRKKKIRILIVGLLVTIFSVLTYELLWGKLFSFSPIIIGFTKHELPHSSIYVQNGGDVSSLTRIDTLIPIVEDFHELKFSYKPKIFIFRDSISFIRHSLSKARFCVYPNGRLFISPWALQEDKENKISLEIYLRHELSHSLIDQNAGLINAFRYPQWLMEGIAVYSSNQMGTSFYPSKEETYRYIYQGNFLQPLDFKTKNEDKIKLNVEYRITFMYSEFACIVDFLIETYGKEKLLIFMKKLLIESDNDKVFKEVYNIEFSQVIQNFRKQVIEYEKNKWK